MTVKRHGVHYDITAENATDRAFRAVEKNLQGISMAGAAVGRALQGAFGATVVLSAGKAFATAAIEAEQASKRLDAVLKATGHSAGLTKKQLDDMADSMAGSTQFDDEGLRNAQAQMLKFGNIHGETFGNAMKLSADLAAFMVTDLNSAVQAVGKALTSPTEGMTALERQVGKFNPAAKEMIKNLVEGGNEAKAQAAVLDLLQGKIGGAAEALNSGLSKAAGGAKKQWDELLESIGKTEAFQKAGKSGLSFLEQSFRDLKSIIEDGDWVEKTLAILAFAGGMRGMKLTPGAQQEPGDFEKWMGATGGALKPGQNQQQAMQAWLKQQQVNRIPPVAGRVAQGSLSDELTGFGMSPRDEKHWKEMVALQAKASEERKRLAHADLLERMRSEGHLAEFNEKIQEEANAATDNYYKQQGELRARDLDAVAAASQALNDLLNAPYVAAAEASQEYADSMIYTWDALGNRIAVTQEVFGKLTDEAKKADAVWGEFGLVMVSAFEDAVVGGKKLKEVLASLAQDLAKMVLRKGVTGPLADIVGDLFKRGSSGGTWFADGGVMTSAGPMPLRSYAGGGVANSPQLAMFGEGSRPEAYVPLPDGRRIPVDLRGGGGGGPLVGSININVQSTGDARQDGEIIAAKVTEAMRNIARSTARTVIGDELRPGGVLSRSS